MSVLIDIWFAFYRKYKDWVIKRKAQKSNKKYMVLSQMVTDHGDNISGMAVSFFDDFDEALHRMNYLSMEYQRELSKMDDIDFVSFSTEEDDEDLIYILMTDADLMIAISVNKKDELI